MIDEAYYEFWGETVLDAVTRFPNLFVTRTFSKAYGVAGLRIGVIAGSSRQMAMVRKVSSPYNVNGVALACLPEAIADREFIAGYARQVIQGRARLMVQLAFHAVPFWISQANFVLANIGPAHREFVAEMKTRGILVRDRSNDPGCDGCVRMTVGTTEHTERLLMALPEVLAAIGYTGRYEVSTGIRFFDHMLELFARHGAFDLRIRCNGDLDVDQHHSVEDVGIALGEAFDRALGNRKGILRAGYFLMTMDETLGMAAIDLSGRAVAVVDAKVRTRLVGDFQSELAHDFFEGFARGARANIHVKTLYGRSNHHKLEALFKAFARALRFACSRDKRLAKMLPSTKGLL